MALTDAQQQEIYDLIAGAKQTALADLYAQRHLNTTIPRQGGGTTTPAAEFSWLARNFQNVPASVWNQNIGAGNAAGVLNHVASQPAGTATNAVTGAPFDTDAFIARIVATLPAATVAAIKNAL
jgi:hypothetical protein